MEALDKKLKELVGTPAPSTHEVDRWSALDQLKRADISEPSAEARIVLLADHWDGHVREAAVTKLGSAHTAMAFQVLIGRLNDWVPQVRRAATQACANFVCAERIDVLLACLDPLLDLTRKSRANHGPFLDKVAEVLGQREIRPAVIESLRHSRGRAGRYLLARMLEWRDVDLAEIAAIGVSHRDFTVRSMFIRECGNRTFPERTPLLRKLLNDAHPKNRMLALLALWNTTGTSAEDRLAIAQRLLDPAQNVRESALWHATQMGFDVTAFLRQQAVAGSLRSSDRIGLMGLIGLTSAKEFLPLVREAFLDRHPAIRRAALAAWAKVARDTADTPTSAALTDKSNKVFKAALQLVRKGKVVLSSQQLDAAATTAVARKQFSRLISISRQLPFWERLECLVGSLRYTSTPGEQRDIISAMAQWQRQQRYDFSNLPPDRQAQVRTCIIESNLADALRSFPDIRFSLLQFESPTGAT